MNNFTHRLLLTLAFANPVALAFADELDLRVSDDSLHGNYSVFNKEAKLQYGLGYFYKDANDSIHILNADLHAKGQTAMGNLPTTVGIGFEGNLFREGDFNGSAIGIGATIRVNIPTAPGLSVSSSLHYAPNVLAFNDADEFKRLHIQLNYRIIANADISLGYRYINVGIEDGGNHTFESGAFLGMNLRF